MSDPRAHHRPVQPGAHFFESRVGGVDPAELAAAADRAAAVLVRGARDADDRAVADRVVALAENEGLETLAELWAHAAPDSVAGCLWRLYALRTWVYADPVAAARQFDAGRRRAPVAHVVAGVAEPPGPEELRRMVDDLLRGIAERDFADVLLRAAAFARVVATGRAVVEAAAPDVVAAGPGAAPGIGTERMLVTSEQLERAGHLELVSGLV